MYEQKAKEARREILRLIHKGHTSHAASNLSVIDIATVLYENLKEEDEVIWSAGWKAATAYYFLSKKGILNWEEVFNTFPNHPYLGLLEPHVPGVVTAGGSVGHGLNVACGMALARKLEGKKGNIYVIMSDGELNEGSTWEAAMFAAHHKLNNLVAIVDKNGWQAMGRTNEVLKLDGKGGHDSLREKWLSFGWNSVVIDGHDYSAIEKALNQKSEFDKFWPNRPFIIVADTVKGEGVSFMRDHLTFHYKHIEDEELERALEELKDVTGELEEINPKTANIGDFLGTGNFGGTDSDISTPF